MKIRNIWFYCILIQLLNSFIVTAQVFNDEAILRGYEHQGDTTYFIFSEEVYEIERPENVVITGNFRGWSQDMQAPQWKLRTSGLQVWILALFNPNMEILPPSTEFKFRIDEGVWLDPPEEAPNLQGGNLVFMPGVEAPGLRAEIRRPQTIWAKVVGIERPLAPEAYRLTNAQGEHIPIAQVLPNTHQETLLVPAQALDIRRVYFLEIPTRNLKAHCSFDGWFRETYSPKALGANIAQDEQSTSFRIFAPRAEMVKLYLYKNAEDTQAYQEKVLEVDNNGIWEGSIPENLKGIYYDFTVHGASDPGNFFYETHPVHISDPYARVSLDGWGKCRVWPKTKAASPLAKGRPKMEDVIAYEVHVQDFTDLLPVSEELKGTLPAMTQANLKNARGEKVGFDYLLDLGINVVHLMPIQEFLHWPDEDWKASFQHDPFMIEQGVNEENYQWGYRTTHAFAVESRFRPKSMEAGEERELFRDLVQAFHDKGIAVIIDIVPNHTGENMDGQELLLNFNALDKQYYYRTQDFKHIGAFGNEVKTENRPMVQRWLIDQCLHWIEEFGIDGFRIDLAGQIDQQTLIALRKAVGEDVIIYGEPWISSNDPNYESNPHWDWYKEDAPITYFQDAARNAFKGGVFELNENDLGYAGGDASQRANVQKALTCTFSDEQSPLDGINYLDIHDNWTLADQFASNNWDGRFGVKEDAYKMAAVLLFTSLGPIVMHGGTEMMRSKGAGGNAETVKTTKKGIKVYMHGSRDTYNLRKANQFVWENVGRSAQEENIYRNFKDMFAFWQGLIRWRLSESGKVFRRARAVSKDYYQWISPINPHQLGYIINKKVFVLLNIENQSNTFINLNLPKGNWKLIGTKQGINYLQGIEDMRLPENIVGNKSFNIELDPKSFAIWMKE